MKSTFIYSKQMCVCAYSDAKTRADTYGLGK